MGMSPSTVDLRLRRSPFFVIMPPTGLSAVHGNDSLRLVVFTIGEVMAVPAC